MTTPESPVAGPSRVPLWDGRAVTVRKIEPADRVAVSALHETTCRDNLRMRFLGTSTPRQARRYGEHLIDVPGHHLALIVDCGGDVLGVASAEPYAAEPDVAEVAMLVADGEHGVGVGTILFRHLADLAAARGIRRFRAEVLLENAVMIDLIKRSGFPFVERDDAGVAQIEMTLDHPESFGTRRRDIGLCADEPAQD